MSSSSAVAAPLEPGLTEPGKSLGLLGVLRHRYLLRLLVRKELKVRYRGSILGLFWSYLKPAMQLAVFYIAMGKFLELEKRQPNFIIYLFSGIVIVNFFAEIMSVTTRSVVANADLVKKIYLPRELFPVSAVWVALVHLLPQVLILMLAAFAGGWRPGPMNILACLGSLGITAVSGLGLGLFFGAINVMFRDSENLVDLILMMATWLSPVLYGWQQVRDVIGNTAWWTLYQLNPGTAAVELAHYGFWVPSQTVLDSVHGHPWEAMPDHFVRWALAGTVVAVALLVLGQIVFKRLEGRFAQEL